MKWYKGNLHCHTNHSDGRGTPDQVGHFYRIQGHDFLGVADHNRLTPPERYAASSGLLGIPCSEYSAEMCCHVVGINVDKPIVPAPRDPEKKRTKSAALQEGINKTLSAGGLPVVCHPHWNWTLEASDFFALRKCSHFEVCNASSDCNAYPVPGYEPGDVLWDQLLTEDRRYYGLANDDAHEYYAPPHPRTPIGGIGFNVVRIPALTVSNVVKAIERGRFYASTGVILKKYRVTREGIELQLHRQNNERAVFQFFGEGGTVLKQVVGEKARYTFKKNEGYVRVRVGSTGGRWAWTQPVFLDDLDDVIRWTAPRRPEV